jgi:hypothetical protein
MEGMDAQFTHGHPGIQIDRKTERHIYIQGWEEKVTYIE